MDENVCGLAQADELTAIVLKLADEQDVPVRVDRFNRKVGRQDERTVTAVNVKSKDIGVKRRINPVPIRGELVGRSGRSLQDDWRQPGLCANVKPMEPWLSQIIKKGDVADADR